MVLTSIGVAGTPGRSKCATAVRPPDAMTQVRERLAFATRCFHPHKASSRSPDLLCDVHYTQFLLAI